MSKECHKINPAAKGGARLGVFWGSERKKRDVCRKGSYLPNNFTCEYVHPVDIYQKMNINFLKSLVIYKYHNIPQQSTVQAHSSKTFHKPL